MDLIKEFSFLFGRDRMKSAFKAVKRDMGYFHKEQENLKTSVNEWIVFLDHENRMLNSRVMELERKLGEQENQAEESELSPLRSI